MTPLTGISIVIPTWNGQSLLERFLPSVIESADEFLRRGGASAEVIVVDDASADSTLSWLESLSPAGANSSTPTRLKVIRNSTNLGFGGSCNRGFKEAEEPLVMLLNNDVELDQGALAFLVENFSKSSTFAAHCHVIDLRTGEVCGTGKLAGFSKGFLRVHRSYACRRSSSSDNTPEEPLYSAFAGGGAAMFDREKFLELGGFDEILAPFYWEDVELSYRAWKYGYDVIYEPRAIAHHQISSTIGKLDHGQVWRVQQRNRLITNWINLHDPCLLSSHLAWLCLLVVTAPFRLQPRFWLAFMDALRLLPSVRRRRREKRQLTRRTDRDVLEIFGRLANRSDIAVYDKVSELRDFGASA
jgi:O-antigen biosynthesis protein